MTNPATAIAQRLRLAIARAVVQLVSDSGTLQALQVELQAGVVRDQVERFQQYGLTSVPLPGAEGIALAVGGSTDHLVLISVDDRRYRLKALAGGEVALYDDQGQAVHLTREGIVVRGAGKPITLTDTALIKLDADVQITGDLQLNGGFNSDGSYATHQGKNIGAAHRHSGVESGPDTSGAPV
jgi:phage baseplate assembly protein V